MKKIFLLPAILILITSCSNNESSNNKSASELEKKHHELLQKTIAKNQIIRDYQVYLDEIGNSVQKLVDEERSLIDQLLEEPKSGDDELQFQLALIADILDDQRYKIKKLGKELSFSEEDIGQLNTKMDQLNLVIEKRDLHIQALIDSIQINQDSLEMQQHFIARTKMNEALLEQHLNKAYFTYGTFKELKENGVAEKKGGILGIGAVKSLKTDFNPRYFMALDIREVKEIPILANQASLISSHPEGSYEWKGENEVTSLLITQPQEFWKLSRHLAVVVD